jgi:two-component system KDP operon response regulator KdpE
MITILTQNELAENSSTIMLIDSNVSTRQWLEAVLTAPEFRVHAFPTAQEALRKSYRVKPDIVLLDIDSLKETATQTCRQLIEATAAPVILLSSESQEDKILAGMEAGASDYVTKPLSAKILIARIRAILRLSNGATSVGPGYMRVYRDGYLTINLADRQLLKQGQKVKLTPTEFRLLAHLVINLGKINTYSELLESVWGREYRDSMDYLYTYMGRLRRKLEPDQDHPRYLLGEHGIGYWFQPIGRENL